MKTNAKFIKEAQKAGAFSTVCEDKEYVICPLCECGTDEYELAKWGVCADCNMAGYANCTGCQTDSELNDFGLCEYCHKDTEMARLQDTIIRQDWEIERLKGDRNEQNGTK